MVGLIRSAFLGSTLLLFGLAANAQYTNYTRVSDPAGEIRQVRSDVDQMIRSGRLPRWQRTALKNARRDLRHFDRGYDRGRFDRFRLNDAIGLLQTVANSPDLSGDHSAMLWNDVQELRELSGAAGSYAFRQNPNANGYYDHSGVWRPYR